MTLSEIETILKELSIRHTDLDEELLRTLLTSAGWENTTIKEALVLYKSNPPKKVVTTNPVVVDVPKIPQISVTEKAITEQLPTDITFYQPDGSEEGILPVLHDVPPVLKKEEPAVHVPQEIQKEVIPPQPVKQEIPVEVQQPQEPQLKVKVIPPFVLQEKVEQKEEVKEEIKEETNIVLKPEVKEEPKKDEPESLIVHTDELPRIREKKDTEIPENLPLLPFESSSHVWAFSKYKDVFHGDVMPQKNEAQDTVVITQNSESQMQNPVPPVPLKVVAVEEDIVVEKVPMTKGDESLVFLAGVMLLAIILILGYMYSNGRL